MSTFMVESPVLSMLCSFSAFGRASLIRKRNRKEMVEGKREGEVKEVASATQRCKQLASSQSPSYYSSTNLICPHFWPVEPSQDTAPCDTNTAKHRRMPREPTARWCTMSAAQLLSPSIQYQDLESYPNVAMWHCETLMKTRPRETMKEGPRKSRQSSANQAHLSILAAAWRLAASVANKVRHLGLAAASLCINAKGGKEQPKRTWSL